MAKGSAKKPKDSKCRGSSAPLEGRDWVRVGGAKWLREVAEKNGKHIPKEYAEKSGNEFQQERAARIEAAENAPIARLPEEMTGEEGEAAEAEAPVEGAPADEVAEDVQEEPEATYAGATELS